MQKNITKPHSNRHVYTHKISSWFSNGLYLKLIFCLFLVNNYLQPTPSCLKSHGCQAKSMGDWRKGNNAPIIKKGRKEDLGSDQCLLPLCMERSWERSSSQEALLKHAWDEELIHDSQYGFTNLVAFYDGVMALMNQDNWCHLSGHVQGLWHGPTMYPYL